MGTVSQASDTSKKGSPATSTYKRGEKQTPCPHSSASSLPSVICVCGKPNERPALVSTQLPEQAVLSCTQRASTLSSTGVSASPGGTSRSTLRGPEPGLCLHWDRDPVLFTWPQCTPGLSAQRVSIRLSSSPLPAGKTPSPHQSPSVLSCPACLSCLEQPP